jgi:hypothetical protein
MSSDAPYWRPPSRALSMVFQTYGLEARFWIASGLPTIQKLLRIDALTLESFVTNPIARTGTESAGPITRVGKLTVL